NNNGSLLVQSGTVSFYSGGDSHGMFHAEAGIRFGHVTGVQTCALPISLTAAGTVSFSGATVEVNGSYTVSGSTAISGGTANFNRSEERRVGKEGRWQWGGGGGKKERGGRRWRGGDMKGEGTEGKERGSR